MCERDRRASSPLGTGLSRSGCSLAVRSDRVNAELQTKMPGFGCHHFLLYPLCHALNARGHCQPLPVTRASNTRDSGLPMLTLGNPGAADRAEIRARPAQRHSEGAPPRGRARTGCRRVATPACLGPRPNRAAGAEVGRSMRLAAPPGWQQNLVRKRVCLRETRAGTSKHARERDSAQ